MNTKTTDKDCWGERILMELPYHPTDCLPIIKGKGTFKQGNPEDSALTKWSNILSPMVGTNSYHVPSDVIQWEKI